MCGLYLIPGIHSHPLLWTSRSTGISQHSNIFFFLSNNTLAPTVRALASLLHSPGESQTLVYYVSLTAQDTYQAHKMLPWYSSFLTWHKGRSTLHLFFLGRMAHSSSLERNLTNLSLILQNQIIFMPLLWVKCLRVLKSVIGSPLWTSYIVTCLNI